MKFLRLILATLFILMVVIVIFIVSSHQKISLNDRTWTLLAVGDIQLSREVGVKIDKYGADYPFEKTIDVTEDADITIGNLESPLTSGKSNPDPNSMVFGAEIKSIDGLKNAGFDLLNLANNHFSNQGQAGMNLTFETLNDNNIAYFGAGYNNLEAHQAKILTVDNIKIAFLGYTDKDVLPSGSIATATTPGVAVMDKEEIKKDIAVAKTQANVIIVSMHSGHEYTPNPNGHQIDFARTAIDSGADVVIGHHPHVVQAIEDYKGKKIFYSLGNFIFDQPWSTETKQGLMVKLTFDGKNLTKTELIPIKIENWSQPRILASDEPEYQAILNRIQTASEKLK